MPSSASCQNLADELYWHRYAKPSRSFRGGLLCLFFTYITISGSHVGATRFLDISSPPFDANALPLISFARLPLQPIAIGKYISLAKTGYLCRSSPMSRGYRCSAFIK